MKKLLILLLMIAAFAMGATTYSGIWNGVGGVVSSRYGTLPATAQMTILQDGNAFSGTMKMGNSKPYPISGGAISGSQLTFHMVTPTGNAQATGSFSATSNTQLTGKMTTSNGQVINLVFTKLQ